MHYISMHIRPWSTHLGMWRPKQKLKVAPKSKPKKNQLFVLYKVLCIYDYRSAGVTIWHIAGLTAYY